MLSKFTFTADYFNIKIADAIVSTPRQFSLRAMRRRQCVVLQLHHPSSDR
jgi:hypothetical protein